MKIKFLLIASFFIVSGNAFSAHSKHLRSNIVKDEILVKYKSKLSSSDQKYAIEREGAVRMTRLTKKGWARVKLKRNLDMESAIEEFKRDPDVEYAQPNYIYHAMAIPNDPRFGQMWGLRNTAQTITSAGGPDSPSTTNNPGVAGKDMNLQYAWDTITDCSSITVAVIDSGINYNHQDLAANMWDGGVSNPNHGKNFVDAVSGGDDNTMDSNGHGTHVAGTIGAVGNNGVGSTGVCWKVKLMAVRVLGTTGSGTSADIVSGINFAVDNGAKVINMSLGGDTDDLATSTAISYALSNDVIVVVAAGNDGTNNDAIATPSFPCNNAQDNLICVGALTQSYALAPFSNYGLTSVDVGAPGVNIVSTWPGTHTKLTDALTTGWNFYNASGTGWAYKSLNFGSPVACLVNPINYNYSNTYYGNNMDSRAWKNFNLASANAAVLNFYLMTDTATGDSVSIHARGGAGDPTSGGVTLDSFSGTTDGYREPFDYDISQFIGGSMSVGFNMVSDSSGTDLGTNISSFSIETLNYNATTYNVISGTSMAAPHVAGLAAMLFAYNPSFTYTDVANAIKNGGVATSSLAGKTTTGKAVSAIGSLNYISAPTGVAAVKLP